MKNRKYILLPILLATSLVACNNTTNRGYTVTWQNADGTVLEIDEIVQKGEMPSFDSNNPTKVGYSFVGWLPEIGAITEDTTYVAQFEKINVDSSVVGKWYIHKSKNSIIPNQFSFTVNDDDTMKLTDCTLSLTGVTGANKDTFVYTYGTITFTVSYFANEDNAGLNWTYKNGNDYDEGIAGLTLNPVAPFDQRIIGTWYIYTSINGVIPQNFSFTVNPDKTLTLTKYTLTLQSNYGEFENAFVFAYGSIRFIVSYSEDEKNPGVDWGYVNTNESDMGFARAEPYSKYEYHGDRFPNAEIKEFFKTTLDLPVYENKEYYLDFFESALYECTCADIELRDTTAAKFKDYLLKLEENGYVFNAPIPTTIADSTFYIAYDSTKTYSLRCIYFAEDNQADIFVYKYMEKLHESK